MLRRTTGEADGSPSPAPSGKEMGLGGRLARGARAVGRALLPKRWIWRILLLALLVIVVGSCATIRSLSRKPMYMPPTQPVPPTAALKRIDARAEAVDYRTRDGIALRGVRLRSGREGAPVLVFFTGNAGTPDAGLDVGQTMAELGVDTFLAAYRGYSGAAGEPCESGVYLDGEAALDAAGVDRREVLLGGFSLGTGVAVELASRGNGRAVLLFGAYTSMVDVSRSLLKDPHLKEYIVKEIGLPDSFTTAVIAIGSGPLAGLAIADHYDSESKIGGVKAPIYLFHGKDDEVVPFEQGRRLASLAPKGELVPVEHGSHYVVHSTEVRAFLAGLPFVQRQKRAE